MTAILGFCDVCNAPVTDSNLAGYDEDGRVCCTNSHKKLPRAWRVILSGITIATQAARIVELESALKLIDDGRCERVAGEGHNCHQHSNWSPDAKFFDDRWCDSCIAHAALAGTTDNGDSGQ